MFTISTSDERTVLPLNKHTSQKWDDESYSTSMMNQRDRWKEFSASWKALATLMEMIKEKVAST